MLQEHEIQRVGDTRPRRVNVRLVAATNKDLRALVTAGALREDFYYRIHVFAIQLPPLRERREDLPLLVNHFIQELGRAYGRPVTGITRDALQCLMAYPWPGNVRELRNAIKHAFVTVQGECLTLLDLPVEIRQPAVSPPYALPSPLATGDQKERQRLLEALRQARGVV